MATKKTTTKEKIPTCGIIMPISEIDNCSKEHWTEILGLIKDVCHTIKFKPNLVSDAVDSGIIQKRIVQNVYSSDIVVCDVSCKNPNVMFELGMRLAFDKPTIIIKDDQTDYSFDTGVIEHLEYRRDLRFGSIVNFKKKLSEKIMATHKSATENENYSTFLKSFGKYKVAHLDEKEVSSDEYMIQAIDEIKSEIKGIKSANDRELDTKIKYSLDRETSQGGKPYSSREEIKMLIREYFNIKGIYLNKENVQKEYEKLIKFLENNCSSKLFLKLLCRGENSQGMNKVINEVLREEENMGWI